MPVVVAIHGLCVGLGCDIISAADVRLCSSDAKFSVRVGLFISLTHFLAFRHMLNQAEGWVLDAGGCDRYCLRTLFSHLSN